MRCSHLEHYPALLEFFAFIRNAYCNHMYVDKALPAKTRVLVRGISTPKG